MKTIECQCGCEIMFEQRASNHFLTPIHNKNLKGNRKLWFQLQADAIDEGKIPERFKGFMY